MALQDTSAVYTDESKLKAAYALNLCSVSISQIIDYNDINILNQEYENILNNLNLEQMPKDEALLDVLKEILDAITFFRMSAGDQKIIDLEYQQRMQNAVWSAIPNVGMIFATSNPIAMGVTLATQVGIGYMNYRRHRAEYQLNRQKEEWQLKRNVLDQLNGLRKQLFETSWRLAKEYNFPDRYRLSDDQIHRYNEILAETNSLKRFNKLDAIRDDFAAYPPYWYQIGSTANCIYQDTEWGLDISEKARFRAHAVVSFEEYRKLNRFNILRNDVLTSSWALEYIDLLDLSNEANRNKAAELVDAAEKYSGKANDVLELCAYAYLKVGDRKNAARIFYYLVNQDYNVPVTAKVLNALYILKSREAGNEDCGTADYKMLERLVGSEYILPMPDPGIALDTWNPVWRTVTSITAFGTDDLAQIFRRATQGDPEAQCHIGICYYEGKGIEQDVQKAVEWYRKAAEQGYADAQNRLGVRYDRGEGVEENSKIANEWFLKAAKQGHVKAQFNIGWHYYTGDGISEDPKQAVYWFSRAAEQGYADAQFYLGLSYYQANGVERNEKLAVDWFLKAANQNNALAQFILGISYVTGEGIEKDQVEGAFWLKKAAEQDNPDALLCLGMLHMFGTRGILPGGFGVIKDLNMAKEYLDRAIIVGEKEGFFMDDKGSIAMAHFFLAKVLYAQNVRDNLDKAPLDIANCIPGVNLISWPITGIMRLGDKPALKNFLTTEDGRSMMIHFKKAAELGDKDAVKMLKKLKKAL